MTPAAGPAPAGRTVDPGVSGASVAAASPVAVVWCRQVDNEAESPGYTTVPEEFPGLAETLAAIRIVGHLTVNVADTHDYWDPDPSQPLSYYPNIFLYPACGGRYTCVGRMFLSTEDRPRLGMKTLVLDSARLLAGGDFGGTIVRWHASMGGGRADGTRAPPVPDPRLYDILGEGLLFHKGTTEPLVAVASDAWEPSVQVILDLIRTLPASLVALGAILAFPYFLPQPKTNLHEFTEELPLALALMRVPRSEASGDRHERRMASWQGAPVKLRDLSGGVPAAARGKETTPLVLQLARDRASDKLAPIAKRVDLVELPRLPGHLADPERQAGRDRRKEMWRIGTAMESAALLLQRARGRHVPVSAETARRAQEYLQARLPEPSAATPPIGPSFAGGDVTLPAQHPPWLQRGPPTPATPAPVAGREVVPVSVSEDPSLLSADQRSAVAPLAAPAAEPPSATVRPLSAPPAPPPPDALAIRTAVTADLVRLLEERLAELKASLPTPVVGLDPAAKAEVAARLQETEARLTETLAGRLAAADARREEDRRASEGRLEAAVDAAVVAAVDRRLQERVDPKLADLLLRADAAGRAAQEAALKALQSEFARFSAEARAAAAASEESLRGSLSAQVGLQLDEAAEEARATKEALEDQLRVALEPRLAEVELRRQRELKEIEQRLTATVDGRVKELQERVLGRRDADQTQSVRLLDERLQIQDQRFDRRAEALRSEMTDAQVRAIADLQVRLQAYTDQKLREDVERERQKYLELLARLRGEVETTLGRLVESAKFEQTIREKVERGLASERSELQRLVEGRVATSEDALKADVAELRERLHELDGADESRRAEIAKLGETVRTELDDLDRRAQILADRLVPVVRRTWSRITELENAGAPGADREGIDVLRRDVEKEIRRVEGEVADRFTEIRDRMETAISNQGRVWLTLVRQLSQLTEDRRVIEESRHALKGRGASTDEGDEEATSLEALPSLLQAHGRAEAEEEDEPAPTERSRRRRRGYGRG